MMLALVLVFGALVGEGLCGSCMRASAVWSETDKVVRIVDGNFGGAVAWASFKNEINHTGWSYLEVFTNRTYNDELQAYAAGAVEAYLTKDLIRMQWNNMYRNYCDGETLYCTKLNRFLYANLRDTYYRIQKYAKKDPYWYQVNLVMKQLRGMDDVYEGEARLDPSNNYLHVTPLLYLNVEGDLIDFEEAFQRSMNSFSRRIVQPCSALVKVLKNNQDIFFAHDTWNDYKSMLRIMKKYKFPFRMGSSSKKIVPGDTVTMSSYPGKLVSVDDFYLVSTGLAVTETTNDNDNNDLWKFLTPNNSVLCWVRSAIANRLATTGKEWVNIFKKYNSGTYNNQWMILDYKLFTPGQPIVDNTFWILEQMPTMIRSRDVSNILREKTYWASYNIAYFKDIFKVSGQEPLVKEHGDYYSHDNCPRAQIFRRDHGKVEDIRTMTQLMRYNDYKHDPLSICNCTPSHNPSYAISSRYDLLDPNGTYSPSMSPGAFGATDMKLTSYYMIQSNLQFIGVSGPTFDSVPPFRWSAHDFGVPHEGHPDLWNFGPVYHQWGDC